MQHSPYIRYAASQELDQLVVSYIRSMNAPNPRPDHATLLAIMERFVDESVDLFVTKAAVQVQLKSSYLKMIESLASLTQRSAMFLVKKVAGKMSLNDHRNAAEYMKQVRLVQEQDGQQVAFISFPIHATFAEKGVLTRDRMLAGKAREPEVLQDGIDFLHAVIDVANLWIFEKPVEILNLGTIMRSLATTTVGTVKKATHSLIDTLVPKISEHQTTAAAEYFSDIVGAGPFNAEYGHIPAQLLRQQDVSVAPVYA